MPNNIEAERALLGAALIGGADILGEVGAVGASDFFVHRHRWIWDAMQHLAAGGEALDVVTVGGELERAGHLGEVGGTAYLAQLIGTVGSIVNAPSYADAVRFEATRRRALALLTETAKALYTANGNLPSVLASAAQAFDALTPRKPTHAPLGEAALEWLTSISDWLNKAELPGLATGYGALDRHTHGLKRGEICILAGRPSMGKSSFAFQAAERMAAGGLHVGIFSLEMPRRDVAERMALARLGLDKFKLTRLDLDRLQGEFDRLAALPVQICDEPGLTVGEIGREAREMAGALGGLDVVIIDHLGYIAHEGERSDTKTARIGNTMKGLVRLAKGMDVAVWALCQLNRAVTQRANHEPDLEDLRESGDIEQDARQVWFVHRPGYYDPIGSQVAKDKPQKAFIHVRKNHSGPRNISVPLAFVESSAQFAEWSGV